MQTRAELVQSRNLNANNIERAKYLEGGEAGKGQNQESSPSGKKNKTGKVKNKA